MTAATAVHKLTTQRKENPTIRPVEGWPWDASMKVIAEGGGSYQEVRRTSLRLVLVLVVGSESEVEGITTDLLLQVTKAADIADTTVTHSYFH